MTRYAAIVDPLSTGQEYAAAFKEAGLTPIAVLSGAERLPALSPSWHPENFAHILQFDGNLNTLAEGLRQFDLVCLVPGAECGVPLYEALIGEVLPGTGNVPRLAAARRDKWAMAQALAASGVPHLRQYCSADPDEIAKWIADMRLSDKYLVVKPPKSGGTDEVHLVGPGGDWRALLDRIVGQVNVTGLVNEAVLVQEYAEGAEYLVDSYSVDGRHGLVDVCRYTKVRNGDRIGIYDRVDFLPPDHSDVLALWPYVQLVLDAVGIRNGCGHAEVVLTSDGPRLVEVAERPAGGGHQLISRLATGDNHILRTVRHRARGEFVASYRLLQHVRGVFISAPACGVWRNAEIFEGIDALPSFHSKYFPRENGDVVSATVDLTSFLAWTVLAGPDEAAIEADYQLIKYLERGIAVEPLPELL